MLSREKNELLCRVQGDTPANRMFRSIWLPALLSSQLSEPQSPPVRLKLLGEPLVAFREGSGRVGIVQAECAHRLAPLFFGKVEEQGIRCAYHGWVFDRQGECVDIPSIADPGVRRGMKITAYRTEEAAGIVWIFMGDGPAPRLPRFPWMDLPATQRTAAVWVQESNWMQGVEGEIDTAHIAVLHKTKKRATRAHRAYTFSDMAPKLSTHSTSIGFMSVARRNAEDLFYWRVTQWMAPMFSFIPSFDWPIGGRAWVPIDDQNTYTWDFNYLRDGELPQEFRDVQAAGTSFPPELAYRAIQLNGGDIIDSWRPVRNRSNDYLVDRAKQGESETTGILGINDQDRAIQEGMGRIADRPRERLVATDRAIVAARNRILEIVDSPASLREFRQLIDDGSAYAQEPLDAVSPIGDAQQFLKACGKI